MAGIEKMLINKPRYNIKIRSFSSWGLKKQEAVTGYLFTIPNVIGTLVFVIVPLMMTLGLSFCDWNFVKGLNGVEFIGFENYKRMVYDERIFASLKNNIFFVLTQIPATIFLSLILASTVHKFVFAKTFIRTIYFVPFITSWVLVSIIFKSLFEPVNGPVNILLRTIGISNPPGWFTDVKWAMPSIVIITIWRTVGYYMVIFLAGLQSIPEELYEAAMIDGANPLQRYFRITLPLLTPSIFFITIISLIGSMKVFDQIAVATQGGPGTSTIVLVYSIYDYAFNSYQFGYSSAVAWLLFVIILIITLIQWKMQKKWVHYNT